MQNTSPSLLAVGSIDFPGRFTASPVLRLCCILYCTIAVTLLTVPHSASAAQASGWAMHQAAEKVLQVVSPAEKKMLAYPFADVERLNWHNIPRPRNGLPILGLAAAQHEAVLALVATGLSAGGYAEALKVMSLEEVLYLTDPEDETTRRARRDPGKYYLTIFGTPSAAESWGWRFEGHHLSLNFTLKGHEVVSSTPFFMGANPATFMAGPDRTLRTLAPREDLARQVVTSLSPAEKALVVVPGDIPKDLASPGLPQPIVPAPVGIAIGNLPDGPRATLKELCRDYVQQLPEDLAGMALNEIETADWNAVHFAWWGGTDKFQPHHYRIQGPAFLFEYNSEQNSGNHIHSVWRNPHGDFGIARQP